MATRIDSTLQATNSTDALFRAWAQFVHDTLITTGGWVDPGDSGQLTISTATHPGVSNTKVGYRIYRMADALQATYPVYMRLDYGSASAANTPGFWVTLGTSSNGSGTITGNTLWNGGASSGPNVCISTSGTTSSNSYGSASTNRVQLALFVQSTANLTIIFSLERTKDSSGNDTGDGLLLSYNSAGGNYNKSRYTIWAGGSQPTEEAGLNYVLSRQNPSSFGGEVGVGLVIHFKGTAVQPGLGVCVVRTSDMTVEGTFSASIYGLTRTYQGCNSLIAVTNQGSSDAATRVCIRYD